MPDQKSQKQFEIPPLLREAILAGDLVLDEEFDRVLPARYEEVSDVQWSSIRVARIVASMCRKGESFVDLGCGVGKLCLLLALLTELDITGIERRPALVEVARKWMDANVAGRVSILQGDILDLDWDPYDVLYLYNPFMEHTVQSRSKNLIDSNIELSRETYRRYIEGCELKLNDLRDNQRVITFHGYGGKMPSSLRLHQMYKVGSGSVRLWEKV